MSSDFLCTIHDSSRKALWMRWLGTDTVPVRFCVPSYGMVEGVETLVYILDADAITTEQRYQLATGLAEHFQTPLAEVYASLDYPGIAIPSAECSLMVLHP